LFLELDLNWLAASDQSSLIVMVSDLDGFKQVNDRFGHLESLRLYGAKESCRQYDYVARMGGDKFVIAPGLAPDAAAEGRTDASIG
jgi:diguanylate cyclase (GGDEF)-like protein